MSQTLLAKIIDDAKRLTDEERESLRRTLEQWPPEPAQPMMTEDEFEEEMERKGILTRPKGPRPDPAAYREPRLIEIEGEPLSETIIRERR